jgi:hypothetical protein
MARISTLRIFALRIAHFDGAVVGTGQARDNHGTVTGQSRDIHEIVTGQSRDNHGTITGQSRDNHATVTGRHGNVPA